LTQERFLLYYIHQQRNEGKKMKVRIQAKRRTQWIIQLVKMNIRWQRIIDKALTLTPEEQAEADARRAASFDALWADIQQKQAVRQLVEEPAEPLQAPRVYTVAKRSTGEVVGTYEDLGDAEEAVLKAHRQKKAALVITNL
jgi:hypothetical protein